MKKQSFLRRLSFAIAGVRFAWRSERSFRAQAGGAGFAFLLLAIVRPRPIWWALFALASFAVLAAEAINTALETVIDRLHPEQHPMIGRAKDCAAGAVLLLSFAAVLVALAMLWDAFF